MGTLAGHLLPGSFFIGFAIWWSFITAIRFVQTRATTYKATTTVPCICLPCSRLRRAPVESLTKIVLGTLGIIGEVITGLHFNYIRPPNKDNSKLFGCDSIGDQLNHEHAHQHEMKMSDTPLPVFFEYVNAQHITMYAGFIIGSIVELFIHARSDFVPPRLDMVCALMAYLMEAFLFAFHLHSRAPLDIRIHVLLVYAIIGCVVFCALELARPDQILFTYGRILFTCLQGTWFWQAGFILYPPIDRPPFVWDRCDHEQVMTVTMMFCWHLILIFIGLFVQLWFINTVYK